MRAIITPLAAPFAAMQAIWLAMLALVSLVWLQFKPSPLFAGLRRWPVPAQLRGTGPLPAASGLPTPSGLHLALLVALLLAACAAYAWALWRARRLGAVPDRARWLVLGAAALMGLTLLILPALPSDDIFSYILYGRISVIYHANPLVAVPAQFPHDPFLRYVYWQDTRAVYGPGWLLASNALTALAQAFGGSAAIYVLLYKLLALGCHLISAALIWDILTRIAPRRRLMGTLLYAWNPLPLWEFAASAHNDALMLALFLGGVALLVRGRAVPGLALWGAAIATKYILVILVPLWLWHTFVRGGAREHESHVNATKNTKELLVASISRPHRWAWWPTALRRAGGAFNQYRPRIPRRLGAVAWQGAVVLGGAVALALPFWHGPATLAALLNSPPAQSLDNSPMEALSWPLRALAQAALHLRPTPARLLVDGMLKVLGAASFVILWGWQMVRRAASDLLRAWAWVLLAYVLLASGWFWPWYVTWPLIIVALRPLDRLTTAVLLLAGGVLTLYGFLPLTATPIYGYRAVVAFGPALGYLAWGWWRARRAGMGDLADEVTGKAAARHGT
jgi:hypothetical protein